MEFRRTVNRRKYFYIYRPCEIKDGKLGWAKIKAIPYENGFWEARVKKAYLIVGATEEQIIKALA